MQMPGSLYALARTGAVELDQATRLYFTFPGFLSSRFQELFHSVADKWHGKLSIFRVIVTINISH